MHGGDWNLVCLIFDLGRVSSDEIGELDRSAKVGAGLLQYLPVCIAIPKSSHINLRMDMEGSGGQRRKVTG